MPIYKLAHATGALDLFLLQTGYEMGSTITPEMANKIHEYLVPLMVVAHKLCGEDKVNGGEWSARMVSDYESTMPEEFFAILWVFIQTGKYPMAKVS